MVTDDQRRMAQWTGEHRCMERKRLLMLRGFREHGAGPDHNLRQARVIAHVLDRYPCVIDGADCLVGKYSCEPLTDAERGELQEGAELLARFQGGLRFGPGSGGVGGHRTIDFERLLRVGVRGVLQEVEEKARLAGSQKAPFYEACRAVLQALLRFAGRYRRRLEVLHDAETDPTRRAELDCMARALARVPAEPPRSFREAIQSAWFVQFAMGFDDASCTGHPDRYLLPFYSAGLEDGSLTREGALSLIEQLYLRSNEVYGDWPETVMVGGTGADGTPVLNDLTRLFVEAIETVGLVNPNVALCYREDTPDDLLALCLDKIGKGLSHPALYNDRVITEGLLQAGLAPGDARYYQNSTCVEITPVGCSNVQVVTLTVNPVKALECLLNDGEPMVADTRWPRASADPPEQLRRTPLTEGGLRVELAELDSYEQLAGAFQLALANLIRPAALAAVAEEDHRAAHGSCPLVSCFTRDCIERGLDAAAGGALYNYCGANIAGFSTAVDSLLAVRETVYRRGIVTLRELADALRRNFEGHEDLRRFLLNRCPKYGNDQEDADAVAVDLYEFVRQELEKYRTGLGGTFHLGCFSGWGGRLGGRRVAAHVSAGAFTGATADGRLAGAPLSENIGPAPGADVSGLTAFVNSVTAMDHRHGLGGISVNWRLGRGMFRDDATRRKVMDLIRTFMRRGGFELQINVVDGQTLREAKAHPELHRGLTVRIAGYSEYFANIGEALQDEIIARTEHEET